MNAEYSVASGAAGPYAHPGPGITGQGYVGQAAPPEVARPQVPSVSQPGVPVMNQQGAAIPQQPTQQPLASSAQHPQQPPSAQHPQQPPSAQQPQQPPSAQQPQSAQHPQQGHVAPAVASTGVSRQHHAAAATVAPQVPDPSGTVPVRSPLRTGTEVTGSGEPGDDKGGILGGLRRIIKREKSESDEGLETSTTLKKKGVGPRRVRAMLTTVDPWSIMKLAFLLSIAMGIVLVVAVAIVWNVLNQMGVFAAINEQITTILGPESKTTFLQFTDRNKIMSVAILLSVVNSILMTGLATIGAFLYNLVVKLVGGVYITLTDE